MNPLFVPFMLGIQEMLLWAVGRHTICSLVFSRVFEHPAEATPIVRLLNPGLALLLLLISSFSVADETRLALFRIAPVRVAIAITRLAVVAKVLFIVIVCLSICYFYFELSRGGTLAEVLVAVYADVPLALFAAGAWLALAFSSATGCAYSEVQKQTLKLKDGTAANLLLTVDGQRGEKRLYVGSEYVKFAAEYKMRAGISGMISRNPVVFSESFSFVEMPYNFSVIIEVPEGLEVVLSDDQFSVLKALIEPAAIPAPNAIDHIKNAVSRFHLDIEKELRNQATRIVSNVDRLLIHSSAVPFLDEYLRDTEDGVNCSSLFKIRISVSHNMFAAVDADARAEYQLAQQKIIDANNNMMANPIASSEEFKRKMRFYEQLIREARKDVTVTPALTETQIKEIISRALRHLTLPDRSTGMINRR